MVPETQASANLHQYIWGLSLKDGEKGGEASSGLEISRDRVIFRLSSKGIHYSFLDYSYTDLPIYILTGKILLGAFQS